MDSKNQKKKQIDKEVVERLKNGDEQAFEIIYDSYHKYIYYLALQYFNDASFADDIVQETFLTVYKNISALESPEAFTVWIKRIAFTKCHDKYKERKRDSIFYADDHEELLDIIFENRKAVSPSEAVNYSEARKIIIETLEKMTPDIRVVGYLRYFEELSMKEISAITGNPIGTTSSRVARIREELQKTLEENGFSSKACCSIVAAPFLFAIYNDWADSISIPVSVSASPSVAKTSHVAGNRKVHTNFQNLYPYVAVVGTLLASIAGVQYAKQTIENEQMSDNCIISIRYDEGYTNKPLKIEVETKNRDYDAVLIDGKPSSSISRNGRHTVSIRKNDVLLDEKEINITNIDMDAPLMTDSVISDDAIQIRVTDKGSGIDYSSSLIKGSSEAVKTDKAKGMFILDKGPDFRETILEVYDLAGNVVQIHITRSEIIRQIK